jgi:hypothetical protein
LKVNLWTKIASSFIVNFLFLFSTLGFTTLTKSVPNMVIWPTSCRIINVIRLFIYIWLSLIVSINSVIFICDCKYNMSYCGSLRYQIKSFDLWQIKHYQFCTCFVLQFWEGKKNTFMYFLFFLFFSSNDNL